MKITLPYPPTDNHYYTIARGRKILSKEGRGYKELVAFYINKKEGDSNDNKFQTSVKVEITVHAADRRKRDIANILKATCDAITHSKIWGDDSQIDDVRVVRGCIDPEKKGYIEVEILEI